MLTKKILRGNPTLIKALTGLPAGVFGQLVANLEAKLPEYEHQRHERPDRQRVVGAGRPYDQPLVIRAMLVLTYMRLHIAQEIAALLFGATQSDVSRELRRLLPLIAQMVPVPEVWEVIDEEDTLSEEEVLGLAQLTDGRALVDATEQPVYRLQDILLRDAIARHRDLFRWFWKRKSRSQRSGGRPPLTQETIALIKQMARHR
jgi:hypothetical protein